MIDQINLLALLLVPLIAYIAGALVLAWFESAKQPSAIALSFPASRIQDGH